MLTSSVESSLPSRAAGESAGASNPTRADAAQTGASAAATGNGSVENLPRAEQLLILPVPMRVVNGRILFEQQACNGVARWADHFDSLTVAAPTLPESMVRLFPSMAWTEIDQIEHHERMHFVPLPWAYALRDHLRHVRRTRKLLCELIDHSDYLHFGIGALMGDWAAEGASIAWKRRRPYAIQMDRVEDHYILRTHADKPLLKRMRSQVYAMLLRRRLRRLISRAALSMCHGDDTFAAYKALNPRSFIIHNVHTSAADQADDAEIAAKIARVQSGAPLTIAYAGRLEPAKAPLEWVRAVARAIERGAELRATWLGDGMMRPQVEAEIKRLGMSDRIALPGFIADRQIVMSTLRQADLLLFTHVTPESPRILIESLNSATPIVGYHSHYAADLIARHRGGHLTPIGAPIALGDALFDLDRSRARLADLIRAAALDGRQFTCEAVFKHRSDLMRAHLPSRRAAAPVGASTLVSNP